MREQLTRTEIDDFHRDGFVLIRGFYDVEAEIRPIQAAIAEIIALVRTSNGLTAAAPDSVVNFDHQFADLIAHDRRLGAVVYDAVKQIPAFVRLVCSRGHEAVYKQLRGSDLVGVAGGGYGIRIDNPGPDQWPRRSSRARTWRESTAPAKWRCMRCGAWIWSLIPVNLSFCSALPPARNRPC